MIIIMELIRDKELITSNLSVISIFTITKAIKLFKIFLLNTLLYESCLLTWLPKFFYHPWKYIFLKLCEIEQKCLQLIVDLKILISLIVKFKNILLLFTRLKIFYAIYIRYILPILANIFHGFSPRKHLHKPCNVTCLNYNTSILTIILHFF